ncbi:MAG: UvrABC system protein A [Chlamydiales bacterium]|nr:UvrABC system protein A [Chlamydiales bacterium]MCH9635745.1 UvrABC system protein A [Chlamydiales bacterium]MCH9703786.1 excinuclease ABC subunit UvrA [Chlamydiota bacterium]
MDIFLKKVSVHNLQQVDLALQSGELILFTGVSGSGKSSMAFDTIYVEGQRRYIESLSNFARRFVGDMSKPDVESVSGLSPTIAIEQKSAGKNPRSTVGTLTEIYDFLRLLYARIGTNFCPISGEQVMPQSRERIIKTIQALPPKSKLIFLAPIASDKKGEFKDEFQHLLRKGFMRARVDGNFVELTEQIELDKNKAHTIEVVCDRLTVSEENQSRIAEAIMATLDQSNGLLLLCNLTTNQEQLFSTAAYSKKSGQYYSSLEPHHFSFNSPSGMCSLCQGLGETLEFDLDLVIDPNRSISEDCCSVASSYLTVRHGNIYRNLAKLYDFDVDTPWCELSKSAQKIFLYGNRKKWTKMQFVHPEKRQSWTEYIRWQGVLHEARQKYQEAKSDLYRKKKERLMKRQRCPECEGKRLLPYPAATQVGGKTLFEICQMTIEECFAFFEKLQLDETETLIAGEVVKEVRKRLHFLLSVGLNYLMLDRTSVTLSGGEAQRVRLASQVGNGLVGVTYVLDEPSIGLHPRDNSRLIQTLKELKQQGNTVIVVEHDEETIRAADRIVDFGPGPGRLGGKVEVNGSFEELLKSNTLTADYLTGRKKIPIPNVRREAEHFLRLTGCCHHNLKELNLSIPLGVMTAVTGVSGSGKSSLVIETLVPALANKLHHAQQRVGQHRALEGVEQIDKVIAIDQSPIGRNPRSNPVTYIKIFDEIRQLFCQLPQSQARGFLPGRFSFNVADGSCMECSGMGMVKVDMDFLEDQWVTCKSCDGKRFDSDTLSVTYKGKTIHDILEMTVNQALDFFGNIPTLKRKLEMIQKVGMGYITLGQPSPTLSGGEAQRIKLAKELSRPATGKTLYILDEPTTGLHFHDIKALLAVLNTLVERGNSVLVIEHNIDVIKCCDHIIDIGPEAGIHGGELVAEGTPEELAKQDSATGQALRQKFEKRETKKVEQKRYEMIEIEGAEQNNLKHISLKIPRGKMTVCTGPSGSGKSSLAFETVYAEGQRRYIESLSPYARQFVKQMPKPKLSSIEGLSPAISIEQKASAGNPRSTIGTMTEIYDYLRLLFATKGVAFCPETGEPIRSISKADVVQKLLEHDGKRMNLFAPFEVKGSFESMVERFLLEGFLRLRLNGTLYELDEPIPFDAKRKNELALVIDRVKISPANQKRISEGVEKATKLASGQMIAEIEGEDYFFNLAFCAQGSGKSYPPITPHTFSFNSAHGMCPDCQGLGTQFGAQLLANDEIAKLSCKGLLRRLWINPSFAYLDHWISQNQKVVLEKREDLSILLNGGSWKTVKKGVRMRFRGLQAPLALIGRIGHKEVKEPLLPLLHRVSCKSCDGARLHPLARNVKLEEHSIASLCQLPIENLLQFLKKMDIKEKVLLEVMQQLISRITFLVDVGLGYLSLDRAAPTLSNGEAQRIKLARQLGSQLRGVLYVLDEPTIGLHPKDNAKLNAALKKLKELGNTLLLVEHDPLTIEEADYLFDFGPGAGIHGGHITAAGTVEQIKKNSKSLTGQYLSGQKRVPLPKKRQAKEFHTIENCNIHNLKDVTVKLPLGCFTCLVGISGSGKSSLMQMIDAKCEMKKIVIDQNPIGQTARADVGTYCDLLPQLRSFFAKLPAAATKGLQPRHFSTNHKRGMCTHCYGLGYSKVEMLFMPAVRVPCDHCKGLRLNPVSLNVQYKGKNFGEFLQLSVEEARHYFEVIPKVCHILDTLISIGLDYLKLGQEVASLSGGEQQRLKLSRDLAKKRQAKTLYLLDEPTTGLHPDDISKLLVLIQGLVDKGHTLVVIEHNTDFIAAADHEIEMGPEAGALGGQIIRTTY